METRQGQSEQARADEAQHFLVGVAVAAAEAGHSLALHSSHHHSKISSHQPIQTSRHFLSRVSKTIYPNTLYVPSSRSSASSGPSSVPTALIALSSTTSPVNLPKKLRNNARVKPSSRAALFEFDGASPRH
jgi:hypothetical protein